VLLSQHHCPDCEIGDGIRCDPQQAQDGWRIQIALRDRGFRVIMPDYINNPINKSPSAVYTSGRTRGTNDDCFHERGFNRKSDPS
jgi:hypothetical protein